MPDLALKLPKGFGFSVVNKEDWFADSRLSGEDEFAPLMDRLLIWQPRLAGYAYVVSVDVSGGVGADRSIIDVTRVATITEPDEQVAQFATREIDAVTLASIIDPIGRYYHDDDGSEALCAIEINGSGIATQGELQRHFGYSNFYIMQYENSADPRRRYTRSLGWITNQRTRPQMLSRYFKAVTTVDPRTGLPDYIINSPITISELRNFQAPPGMSLAYAEAASGNDDAVMAGAIAAYVCWTFHADSVEPLNEQRHRIAEEKARQADLAARMEARRDYQNTDISAAEMADPDYLEEEGYLSGSQEN